MHAGEPDAGLDLVDHLGTCRHVAGIELGEQRVAQAVQGADPQVMNMGVTDGDPALAGPSMRASLRSTTRTLSSVAAFRVKVVTMSLRASVPRTKSSNRTRQTSISVFPGSGPGEDLQHAVAWCDVDDGPLRAQRVQRGAVH